MSYWHWKAELSVGTSLPTRWSFILIELARAWPLCPLPMRPPHRQGVLTRSYRSSDWSMGQNVQVELEWRHMKTKEKKWRDDLKWPLDGFGWPFLTHGWILEQVARHSPQVIHGHEASLGSLPFSKIKQNRLDGKKKSKFKKTCLNTG